ncbi:MAG: Gfo/Idh/MocA family protein, partial [Ilumatobacteraceae bacterium]
TDAFAAAGLIGGVGHIERYNAAIIEMRDRIARGELGTVFQVSTRRQGPFPGRIGDVGVVKDLATHDIDLTAWVTGQGYADVSSRLTHRVGRPFEDMLVAIGRLDGGTIVSHTVNWLTPFKERTVVAHGERGALVADTLTADLTFHANGIVASEWDGVARFRGVSEGDVTRFAFPRREPLMVEHETFRDAVRTGDASGIVDFEQGTRVVDVATRIIDADPSRPS